MSPQNPVLRPALCAVLLFGPCAAAPAQADSPLAAPEAAQDLSTRFPIDAQDPEKSVPSPEEAMKNPLEMGYLMMDMIARAEAATQRGEHAAAVRYYKALAKAVPDRAVSYSKLCKTYEAMGQRKQALESCRVALGKGGVEVMDYARFVRLTLEQSEPLSDTQRGDLDAIVGHLETELAADAGGRLTAAQLRCEIATKLEDTARLRECVQDLTVLDRVSPTTLTFRWALAMRERAFDDADTILEEARRAKLPAAGIVQMEEKLKEESRRPLAWIAGVLWALGGTVVASILGLFFWNTRRKPRLGAA